MVEPRYVQIANKYAREIRSGTLPPKTALPSYVEIAREHNVSEIVVRKAIDQLDRAGLVRRVERRGTYVAERPTLTRLAPERQMESPETTYGSESDLAISVQREIDRIGATDELAAAFGIPHGAELVHVVTRASEGEQPVSISDTFHLPEHENPDAVYLEETLAERMPAEGHAAWLGIVAGESAVTVHQRFLDGDDRLLMVSDVSYPRGRYQAFSFRMVVAPDAQIAHDG
ncbi:GntR family transcriptional regulator [Nocardia altamirensis]|uniref:GntR family transcriptional regulator n=1 Tax=Nocardia altamirensis TaxID=472158 RepID=UPI0008407C26|nr:GntR family transcriptional regulator [Nocardia altamirensis]